MTLGYPTSDMVLGLNGQRSRLRLRLRLMLTVIQRGFELYECLLVDHYSYDLSRHFTVCSNQIKSTVDLVRLLQLERRRITLSRLVRSL